MRPRLLPAVLLLATAASAQDSVARRGLEQVAARVDEAAGRVSLAAPAFLGHAPTRAYLLPGSGAVVVLAPRVLPVALQARRAPTAPPAAAPVAVASRLQLEQALFELRTSLERTQRTAAVTNADLHQLERQAQERLAAAARARIEAFRALSEAMSDPGGPATAMREWPSPDPAGAPQAPAVVTQRVQQIDARPPRPADVIAGVRRAVRDSLPELVPALGALADTESLSVAVDFVLAGSMSGASPRRTMVVRARMGDLRAVAAGQRPRSSLAEMVEVTEY